MHHIKRVKCVSTRGVWDVEDMSPQENFYFRPSEIAFGAVLG